MKDYVVSGTLGGLSRNSERVIYIVSAENKIDAKDRLKRKLRGIRKVTASLASSYTEFDPYDEFEILGENKMRLTKGQLKRIIKEEYSRLKQQGLLQENTEAIDGHLAAEVANDAYQEGIRRLGDFIAYFMDGYPEVVAGLPKRVIRAELASVWKLEKAANRPFNKYDNWSAWD